MYTPLPVAFITIFVCIYASPVPQDAQTKNRAIAAARAVSTTSQTADASNPTSGLLAGLDMIPIIGQSVTAISNVLTTVESTLATALNVVTTENSDGAAGCKDMTVIFARGTTEPGNVGLVTGPPFFDALSAMIGQNSISVQGVDYPGSIEGFLEGGDAAGSQTMASPITSTLNSCPNTKLVMSGYSQGAQLVHNAAKLLPASTMAQVSSVVMFGDPDFGEAVAGAASSNTKVICHLDDDICKQGDLILLAHLTYSENAQEAAIFAATAAGMALGN